MFDTNTAPAAPTSPIDQTTATTGPASQPQYPFRLLRDEKVLAMYPVARVRRPLGQLASYLFVTDSRLVYSAEAKTIVSTSAFTNEYHIDTIKGLSVGRHKGLSGLGAAALFGSIANFVFLIVITGILASLDDAGPFAVLTGILAFGALIVGAINALVFRATTSSISVFGPEKETAVSAQLENDLIPKSLITLGLFAVFGPLAGIANIIHRIAMAFGLLTAGDAPNYSDINNADRISYEAGALIHDIQARGIEAGN